ncbi:hypothetical protein DICPUDRAFT_151370 [Dictyostelium purpureum]|uniref:WASH complex subunit strumpellin n=1 Tax=Dictyostelium purpureum TaxID=5786 RepID=F0ZIN4_DICPU|nr:uncharacterized protein DICPUDRAFT_151370 [Dictyostelium purpureum]EGC36216.1 hypothetical protein DICPUDRAFT_151370 [Dictyostelium purpureum]|eukprot:XP_003287283.1 hypothetical protein DICPUDRAFT_151370 [Dictyostelium purpureum]
MVKEFLGENSQAGQNLLRLVSRGNAIISEILRLSQHIPSVFKLEDRNEARRYQDILLDFKYLSNPDFYESKIEENRDLVELEAEFRDNHIDILVRFYHLFESIYKYIVDLEHYIVDVEKGFYIHLTIEAILINGDGKQLLSEAVYLYGVMLILMDNLIEGPVRERMLISYLRNKGPVDLPLIDDVCKLCKSTGYIPGGRRPANYPEEYFKRVQLPENVLSMIVGRLRSDDIYNGTESFPQPEHRSVALATQACMVYVILYFIPDILNNKNSIMREIVDKFFPDNWVISFFLGFTIDLSVAWEPYRAAKTAMANTITLQNVQYQQQIYWKELADLNKLVEDYLLEGLLVEEYIVDNVHRIINCIRRCNVTIRWLMLHTNASQKRLKDLVSMGSQDDVLSLLLNTAQLEFVFKNIFQALLATKEEKWEENKKLASESMVELSEYFSGEKALTRVKKNENLQKWFSEISNKINSLDSQDSTSTGRKIQQLSQALEEVEQFQQIDSSIQVKQFLIETRQFLTKMIKIVNIKEEVLINLSVCADMSYAWDIINNYVEQMQRGIKQDPKCVLKLRATFLKLVSILDLPLVRIAQCSSPDLISVSEYYSSELVGYVRKVLEIVPKQMFLILKQIINMQTNNLKELPTKVEKEKFRDYAQLEQRYELAKATHSVSVFTEGILAMETTLVGIIEVDPKQLLEDGIRKELVLQIAQAMDRTLVFNSKNQKQDELLQRLRELSNILDGFRRSFQYIQDYVNIQGLKIWQEEFSRIVNFYVEQECNSFLKKKIYDWQSSFQSVAIPIPRFAPPPGDNGPVQSVNMIGRLARELLNQTNCKNTLYLNQIGWFDPNTGKELVGINTWSVLHQSVGIFGLTGLDKLFCFMMVKDLQVFVTQTRSLVEKSLKGFIKEFEDYLIPTTSIPDNIQRYQVALEKTKLLGPIFSDVLTKIGQIQLIRRQISNQLNFHCKIDSNMLFCSLDIMNKSLLKDIQSHFQRPDEKNPYPSDDNTLLSDLSQFLDTTGINDPFTKIYITTSPLEAFPCLLFLFVLSQVTKFQYNSKLNVMQAKKQKNSYDWTPFITGCITILQQFHSLHTQKFLAFVGQYIKCQINISLANPKETTEEYPEDVVALLRFLEDFCKYSHTSRNQINNYIPPYLFDHFNL